MGAGPGRIFPPVDGGEGGFLSLVTVGIVVVGVVLLWAAGALLFVVELVGAMFVFAAIIAFVLIMGAALWERATRRCPPSG